MTFTVDTVAPVVSITSPTENTLFNTGNITVVWGASDATSGIDHYNYRVDGGAWSADITATTQIVSNLADGAHTIDVRAVDKAGNEGTASVSFTIDTTAPIVIDHSPTGMNVSLDSTINVTFSEPMDLSSVQIVLSGITGTVSWSGNTAIFTPDENLTAGTLYVVNVTGEDVAGNRLAPYSWNFTTKSGSPPPVITTHAGSISGVVMDDSGSPVAGATVSVEGTNLTTITDSDGHFLLENVSVGQHTLSISGDGFLDSTASVTVTEGETSTINPVLHPISSQPPKGGFPWWIIILVILGVLVIGAMWMKKKGGKSSLDEWETGEETPVPEGEGASASEAEDYSPLPPSPSIPAEAPAAGHPPHAQENAKAPPSLSKDELIANLEAAYREGRISEELYLQNLEKFRRQ